MVRIGFSISKNPSGKALSETILDYNQIGLTAFQICMTSSHNGHSGKKLSNVEINHIKEIMDKNLIYGVVHGKLIYNFSRQNCDYQIDQLVNELELANDIGCDVIIHQGKNVEEEQLTRLQALEN